MKIMHLPLLILLLGLSKLCATTQRREYLEYQSNRVEISTIPLESLNSAAVKNLSRQATASSCWRGYVGVWKIQDQTLFLSSLHRFARRDERDEFGLGKKIPLKEIFPESIGAIPAKWFSGSLRIPVGEKIHGHNRTEFDHYLTIEKGSLIATTVIDNKGAGAARSTCDLKWVTSTVHSPLDKGEWIDARVLAEKIPTEKEVIVTRGICYPKRGKPTEAWLMIPRTLVTENVNLTLSDPSMRWPIKHGCHVEVVAIYSPQTQSYLVEKIRKLVAGESIHHPKFEAPEPPDF